MLSPVEKAGLALMIFVLMLGMGATLSRRDFATALKRPKGIVIGMLSQFGIMPLLAFGVARLLGLPDLVAISLIMVGATPGGTTSNLFTYFSRGDVSLSISMTVASSLAATVMMPLLVGFYVTSLDTAIQLPIAKIIPTIAIMLLPVCIGMFVRGKSARVARRLEKTGGISGLLIIALLIISVVSREGSLMASAGAPIYIAVSVLALGGFTFGYLSSRAAGLSKRMSRTVSVETGIQNTPLTFAVILASFPESSHAEMMMLPVIYAVSVIVYASIVTVIFRKSDATESDDDDQPVMEPAV